jgi:hypothetical protein
VAALQRRRRRVRDADADPVAAFRHRGSTRLYDGLQIKHLNEVIALVSYGVAVAGSAAAAYVIWQVP